MPENKVIDAGTIREVEALIEQHRREIIRRKDSVRGSQGMAAYKHKDKSGYFTTDHLFDMYDATEIELNDLSSKIRSLGGDSGPSTTTPVSDINAILRFIEDTLGKYVKQKGWEELSIPRRICEVIAEHPRVARVPHDKLPFPQ